MSFLLLKFLLTAVSLCYTQVTWYYALVPHPPQSPTWHVRVVGCLQWLSSRLLPHPCAWERLGDGRRPEQASQDLVSWWKGVGYQPALRLQFAAYDSQGKEGWGTVCGDKLLPEKLHVEAKVQCSGQAIRICIHLPDDLQVRRWLVRNGLWRVEPQSRGKGCWFMDRRGR